MSDDTEELKQESGKDPKHIVVTEVKKIIEVLLFCSHKPLSTEEMIFAIGLEYPLEKSSLLSILKEMKQEYMSEKHCMQMQETEQGFMLATKPQYASYIQRLSHISSPNPERLSAAAIEVLAIIAYRAPTTRGEIDAIRGVDSSTSLHALLEKDLIYVSGKKEVPGRPSIYCVTPRFFQHFGIKDVKSLPLYAELSQKQQA